jgi:hypothetical protein
MLHSLDAEKASLNNPRKKGIVRSGRSNHDGSVFGHRMWQTRGTQHYAKSLKIAGSISDEITGFLNKPNPSSRTMALGSIQPLTEMSTRNIPRV